MAQKGSMQFVPPPMSHLLKYPIKDDVNIEEGLCKPENDSLFLISSIAFLQKQLMKKLERQDDVSGNEMGRKYSDLLIVESGQKYMRQKRYIRLANIEKFDEVLKSEASLPLNVLSNTQLLPSPKKSKSPKFIMSNIFKPKSSTSIPSGFTTKKSLSVFNLFKKVSNNGISAASEVEKALNSVLEFDTEKIVVITENEKSYEEHLNLIRSSSSISIAKTASTLTVYENGDSDSTAGSVITAKNRALSEAEEEILRIIPKESNLVIKKSINEKMRCSRKSSLLVTEDDDTGCFSDTGLVKKEDDFYEDPETGIKFKCMPRSPAKPKRLKEQQSKLSVCIEEETESEIDYSQEQRKYPFNCTDDVKALVSSEAIDLIINEVWQKLDPESK